MKKVENVELDTIIAQGQRLPNGEAMDLWNLRSDILFYGVSIEGDDYVSLLFFSPADALFHLLNPIFIRDSIGVATKENPANTKSSKEFYFNNPFRLREYRLDVPTKYYDARKKNRPSCLDVGASNFKVDFNLVLPLGTLVNGVNRTAPKTMEVDEILRNIVNNSISNKAEVQVLKIEGFHFCAPGKNLKIEKSFIVNMSLLWTFYAALLKKGYDPNTIRSKTLLDPTNGPKLIGAMITSTFVPSTLGDLPRDIADAIQNGASLEVLLNRCSVNNLTQRICISGLLFKKLWERDVPSIKDYFKVDPKTKEETFTGDPMQVKGWLFKEDFNQDMGRDIIAYNWNYNRFLDVNTTIAWAILNLKVKEVNFIHRFTMVQIGKFKKIVLYDADYDLKVELNFEKEEFWIFVRPIAEIVGAKPKNRVLEMMKAIQTRVVELINKTPFEFRQGFGPNYQILTLTKEANLEFLPFLSSFLRYLLKREEFVFFNFE
jgi:hypothetical protein